MSKKVVIASVLIVAVLGTLGGVGYVYYNAASNMVLDIQDISIDEVKFGILTVDVDISYNVNATSPSVSLSLSRINYEVDVEGNDFGEGFIEDFKATKESTLSKGELSATDLGLEYFNVFTDYINGQDIDITITITSVVLFGLTINIDYVETVTVNKND